MANASSFCHSDQGGSLLASTLRPPESGHVLSISENFSAIMHLIVRLLVIVAFHEIWNPDDSYIFPFELIPEFSGQLLIYFGFFFFPTLLFGGFLLLTLGVTDSVLSSGYSASEPFKFL